MGSPSFDQIREGLKPDGIFWGKDELEPSPIQFFPAGNIQPTGGGNLEIRWFLGATQHRIGVACLIDRLEKYRKAHGEWQERRKNNPPGFQVDCFLNTLVETYIEAHRYANSVATTPAVWEEFKTTARDIFKATLREVLNHSPAPGGALLVVDVAEALAKKGA